jgi:Uma2 family endonuclease
VNDGPWLELVQGDVIALPRRNFFHSYTGVQLVRVLDPHIDANQSGILYAGIDIVVGDDDVRVPDLVYYCAARAPEVSDPHNDRVPDFCIEITSPSNAHVDRVEKFELYQTKGVRFYWIVDPEERTIESYALEGGRYVSAGRGAGDQIVRLPPFPALEIPLAVLWFPAKR